jgi:two-component sensor histidine kinase
LKQGAITHVPEIGVLQNGAARLVTQPGMRSALLVPLQQSDGKPLGILAAVSREPNHFSQQDQQLGRQVAVVLSSAIENRRLLEQTQQALAQTDTLYRVVREIASAPDLQELLRVTAGAMRLPFINRLVLYRLALDAAGEILSGRIVANWSNGRGLSPAAVGLELPLEQVMFVQPLFGAEPLLVDNVQTDGRLNSIAREITMLSSGVTIAALPLLVGDQRTGALLFEGDEPHSWSVEEQSFLTSLASAVAVAMERFRLFEETRVALNEARRSAERERESAELVSALNRRLTREGWQDYFAHLNSNLVVESAAQEHANGNGVPHETAEDAESHSTNGEGKVTFPISLRGEVIGEIELEPGDPAAISEDNLGLITHVAENLGVALDNARLVSETQRRVSELNALNQISTTITSQLEFETLLNVIGEQLRRIFNTENVYIALYDRATDMISLPYFVNDGKRVSVEPIRYGEGISSHIIRTREPLLINKYADARMGELGAKVFGNPARSFLGVPVFVGDEVTGVMTVQDMQHEDVFDESNLNLMQTIAATVGAALQNAQLYSAIKQEVVVRQRAEEEIKLSLREKEVLLKEIHHRVKNNLQIITSLLNLQSAQIKDPDAFGMFRESQARVRSMALIHEKLYQSKDLARIDFDSYVRDLLVYLFRSYAVNPDQIRPEIQEHSMFLGIDTAIPCGLIISELVTNALKYAFPDGKRGSLRLGVGPEDDGHLTLEVSDTGAGFKPGFNWRESDSLGLQLVSTLTAQLHGLVNVHSDASGTSFKITFPG